MEILFGNTRLEKDFSEGTRLVRVHGTNRAKKIKIRLAELRAAKSLMDFWPPKSGPSRCHELSSGMRRGQLSMDLDHPYRLIFVPAHDPLPCTTQGGLDWAGVTAIVILGVEDTHG